MPKQTKFKRTVLAQAVLLGMVSGNASAALNMTVSFGPDSNVTTSSPFMPTASGANLNISTLLTALELGNVIIDTTGVGTEDGDITLLGDLDFASATASNNLILNADGDISINGSIYNSNSNAVNKLDDLTLNADRNNDGVGDVLFNDSGFNALLIDIAGDLHIGANTQDVIYQNAYGGIVTADNIDIGAGTSTTDRIDGEVIVKPGYDGFDLDIQSNTLDIFANGDVELDAGGTGNRVTITSMNSQRIFADDVIVNSGGSGQTGFRVTSASGTQEFNTGGDFNLDVGTGNQDAVATSAGSQDLTIRGSLRLNSNANAMAKISSGGNQAISTGVANPGLTSIVLEGTNTALKSELRSGGIQTIDTNGGVLILNRGKTVSMSQGSITVGDLNSSNGAGNNIDLSGGVLTINSLLNPLLGDLTVNGDLIATNTNNSGTLVLSNLGVTGDTTVVSVNNIILDDNLGLLFGGDVNITANPTLGGTAAGNITVASEINLSGTNLSSPLVSHSLTLQAYNDINIHDSIRGTGANKLTNLNLFADMDNDSNGDVNINSSGTSSMRIGTLDIDVLGSVNIDGNAHNVTITADTSFGYGGNVVINAGAGFNVGSSSNRIGGDFDMVSAGGSNGESVQILSDTFSLYADGDVKLIDGAFINGVKEVTSTSSQIVDVNDILLQGNGNAGAILRLTGAGSQTVNASGTTSLLAGSGAVAIIDTQNASSSQTINSAGKLLINFSSNDAYFQAAGSQNITVGTSGTPSELEITGGAGPTNNGRIQGGAGTQNITVHGNLKLTKGNIIGGSGTTTVSIDDLNFSQGLIDLNTGTFTINGGSIGSMIDGMFNAQFNDATITNASGSTVNHSAGSFILNNSTLNNQGTFNNQGGTFRLDDSTFNNTSTASLGGSLRKVDTLF